MTIHEIDLIFLSLGCQQLANADKIVKKFKEDGVSEEDIKNFYDSCKRMINNYFRYNTDFPVPFQDVFDEE